MSTTSPPYGPGGGYALRGVAEAVRRRIGSYGVSGRGARITARLNIAGASP